MPICEGMKRPTEIHGGIDETNRVVKPLAVNHHGQQRKQEQGDTRDKRTGGSTLFNRNLLIQPRFARIIPLFCSMSRAKLEFRSKNRAIPMPPRIRPRNRESSLSISRTLFSPPFSAIRFIGLAIIVGLPQGQQRDPSHHRSEQRSRQVRWALLWGPFGTTLIAPTSALATATCALLIVW